MYKKVLMLATVMILGVSLLGSVEVEARSHGGHHSTHRSVSKVKSTKSKAPKNKAPKKINKEKSKTMKQKDTKSDTSKKNVKSDNKVDTNNNGVKTESTPKIDTKKSYKDNKTNLHNSKAYTNGNQYKRSSMDSFYRLMFYYNLFTPNHSNKVNAETNNVKESLEPVILPKTLVDGDLTKEDKELLKELGISEDKVKELSKKGEWVTVETKDKKEMVMLVSKEQKDLLKGSKLK